MISIHKAVEIAERLAVLDEYPRGKQAVMQIAQMLVEFIENDKLAETFVSEVIDTLDRWPGPRTLRTIYKEHVAPRKAQDGPLWEKPELCPTCESWGWVQQCNTFNRCACEAGRLLDQKVLDHLNRSKKPLAVCGSVVAPTNLKLITMAEVEAERERQKRLKGIA